MKMTKLKSLFLIPFFGLVLTGSASAQNSTVNVDQDAQIKRLLEVKTQMSKENKIGDRYRIQLFYGGDNNEASKVFKDYSSKFDYPAMIDYESPNYKVFVGNFRNRLEADRALVRIKEAFPGAFIPKPKRK